MCVGGINDRYPNKSRRQHGKRKYGGSITLLCTLMLCDQATRSSARRLVNIVTSATFINITRHDLRLAVRLGKPTLPPKSGSRIRSATAQQGCLQHLANTQSVPFTASRQATSHHDALLALATSSSQSGEYGASDYLDRWPISIDWLKGKLERSIGAF